MTYDELLQTIASSRAEDWITVGVGERDFIYKPDLNVSFALLTDVDALTPEEQAERMISKDWAQAASTERGIAYHRDFQVLYAGIPVVELAMAEIILMGTSVYVPFPDYMGETSGPVVREWQRKLAVVATPEVFRGDFDSFFERSGISVEG